MQIALLGGSFDPPHNGHIALMKKITMVGYIDQLWLVPANTHPWKKITATQEDRLAMLQFLTSETIKVCTIDIARGGQTYTIDTIRHLQATTNHTYFWICGMDMLSDLEKWKDYKEIIQRVKFLVFPREGYTLEMIPHGVRYEVINMPKLDISSTQIRQLIKNHKDVSGLLPKKVALYIKRKGLYL